jgi:hypothetical protein
MTSSMLVIGLLALVGAAMRGVLVACWRQPNWKHTANGGFRRVPA